MYIKNYIKNYINASWFNWLKTAKKSNVISSCTHGDETIIIEVRMSNSAMNTSNNRRVSAIKRAMVRLACLRSTTTDSRLSSPLILSAETWHTYLCTNNTVRRSRDTHKRSSRKSELLHFTRQKHGVIKSLKKHHNFGITHVPSCLDIGANLFKSHSSYLLMNISRYYKHYNHDFL